MAHRGVRIIFNHTLCAAVVAAVLASCQGSRHQEAQPPAPSTPPIAAPPPKPAPEPVEAPAPVPDVQSGNPLVKVRLFHGTASATFSSATEIQVESDGKQIPLAPGTWTFLRTSATPPIQQFHVFTKTFRPGEELARDVYMNEWRAKGYDVQYLMRGDRYATAQRHILDGRQYWISMARATTEVEAQRIVKQLEAQNAWAWIRAETLKPGVGAAVARAADGRQVGPIAIPLALRCDSPVTVKAGERSGKYTGAIELWVEPDRSLGVYETLPMEEYLAGVLPAEMPAVWPLNALKAQAVAARSDILQHLGFKHILEGFHFTNSEGDRMYGGFGGRHASSDSAVLQTRGQVLVNSGRIVPAVFSSNCGGWSENNENVWSSPPDLALRGTSDLADSSDGANPSRNIAAWVERRPAAHCAGDEKGYRWTRRYTASQLSALVNKHYNVGTVTAIEPGERGVSGRLKSVKVIGSQGTAVIRKELPIRQAFGDLPSSVLIIKVDRGSTGPTAWTFIGGGRGHGVGLCQHGARGMALKGFAHDVIVSHYFSGSALETVN